MLNSAKRFVYARLNSAALTIQVVKQINERYPDSAVFFQTDVSKEEDVARAVHGTVEKFGRLGKRTQRLVLTIRRLRDQLRRIGGWREIRHRDSKHTIG